MNILFSILIISFSWAIGILGVGLPTSAESLALSNSGIASPLNTSINSSYNFSDGNKVSFSSNYWFEGVSGKSLLNQFGKHEISLNTFSTDDLDLWGEKPDSNPLGEFKLQFSCLSYRYLFNQDSNQNIGIKLKGIYSKLYTESMYGLLFDAGFNQKLNKYFKIGLTLKNVGYLNSELITPTLPSEYGLGLSLRADTPQSQVKVNELHIALHLNESDEERMHNAKRPLSLDLGLLTAYHNEKSYKSLMLIRY